MSITEIKVPNIGDFKDVEVIEVLVTEGQKLKKNDPLITIESDKSSVEIPSISEAKIKRIKIKLQIFHLQVQKFENLQENLALILIKFRVVKDKVGLLKVI